MAAKTVIKVNRNVVDRNKQLGDREPVLTALSRGRTHYGDELHILDAAGNVVARVVYRPDQPQPCGATVWIETHQEVRIFNRGQCIALPGSVVHRGGRLDDFLAELGRASASDGCSAASTPKAAAGTAPSGGARLPT